MALLDKLEQGQVPPWFAIALAGHRRPCWGCTDLRYKAWGVNDLRLALQPVYVGGNGALGPLFDREFDSIPFGQCAESALTLNRGMMHEHVVITGISSDETVPFLVAELLDDPCLSLTHVLMFSLVPCSVARYIADRVSGSANPVGAAIGLSATDSLCPIVRLYYSSTGRSNMVSTRFAFPMIRQDT
jgi:hypothetical protein